MALNLNKELHLSNAKSEAERKRIARAMDAAYRDGVRDENRRWLDTFSGLGLVTRDDMEGHDQ